MTFNLTHDGPLAIATGKSREDISWKNVNTTWGKLLDKVATPKRTHEKYVDYIAATPKRQGEIKDVGGFVGGTITGGRRKAGAVLSRSLLTLDLDHLDHNPWPDFVLLNTYAAAIYSTHKHCSDKPRLRLLVPLDREVLGDEYIAIARSVAGSIGINQFDDTTFQPERLMYWPSCSEDGEFLFEYQDGPWLSADTVLASYRDWKDSSQWPISSRVGEVVLRGIAKQGDPLEKPGIIGAFCRTYSLTEVLEGPLADVYAPTDKDDRYTFAGGSTSGGLVVYDDKYAYSHHGTDPTSGKLCNAFDLVRLHKFGLQDEEAAKGTPVNKLPSYQHMLAYAAADKQVKILIGEERLAETRADFEGLPVLSGAGGSPANTDWLGELEADKKGNYLSTIENLILILENDPLLKGCFAYDEFAHLTVLRRALPWRKVAGQGVTGMGFKTDKAAPDNSLFWTDADDAALWHYIERHYYISHTGRLAAALSIVVRRHGFHPIQDCIKAVEWDGVPRADALLIDYLGAADTAYTRAITRKMLCAAVGRIFRPGIKFEYVVVLVGEEGIGKSSIFDALAGNWFSDSFYGVDGPKADEQVQGVWVLEIGELAGIKKADAEKTKTYISKRIDRFRVAYGKHSENFPRQCIFVGTGNLKYFLSEAAGNRRFWPVQTRVQKPGKNIFTHFTEADVLQVWAEAYRLWQGGEPLFLDAATQMEAKQVQRDHTEEDDRLGLIQEYLSRSLPEEWQGMTVASRRDYLDSGDNGPVERVRVCAAEIFCEALKGTRDRMTKYNVKEVKEIMRQLPGWEEHKGKLRYGLYGVQRGWVKVLEMPITATPGENNGNSCRYGTATPDGNGKATV